MDQDYKDPATMSDEELDAILNPPDEVEEEVIEEESEEKPEPKEGEEESEEQEEEEEKEEPEAPEKGEEEQPQPSRREQLRISKLLEKYGSPEAPKVPEKKPSTALNYEEELEVDPETRKVLEDDREKYADQRYQEGLEQAKSIQFTTRLELDAPKVEAKYTFLDPSSEDFNPHTAEAMNNKYLSFVGFDPNTGRVRDANIRYADFVEAEMEFANAVAERQIQESTKRVVKQAAQTSLRPDGSSAKRLNLNKAPEDMSDEELDAMIASSIR